MDQSFTNSKVITKKRKGPFSMEKEEDNFQQLRKVKMKQISFGKEKCKICNKEFESVILADKHVRRNSCFAIQSKSKKKRKKVYCEICELR